MKPKGLIHNYFKEKLVNNKTVYYCVYCGQEYSSRNATRFKNHIQGCKSESSAEAKSALQSSSTREPDLALPSTSSSIATSSPSSLKEKDKDLNNLLAEAMYVTGTPFQLFEHPTFKKWLNELNPNYKVASRKVLASSLLDQHYTEMFSKVEETIKEAKILHLSVDGWSNLRNEGILNVIVYTPKPVLYCTIQTKDNRHTSSYLAEELTKVIETLGSGKFVTIITDNAANMKRCGQILKEKYTNIQWTGCVAHTLHLCVLDVLNVASVSETVTNIVQVVKTIKKSQILSAVFKQLALEKNLNISLHLPVKTRWGSYAETLDKFLKSKIVLQNLALDDFNANILKTECRALLLSDEIWVKAKEIYNIISCFTKWITVLEGDYTVIHRVVSCFKEITDIFHVHNNVLSSVEITETTTKINNRKTQALHTFHYAACILDPQNRGSNLTEDEHLKGCECIIEIVEAINANDVVDVMQQLSKYKSKTGMWENSKINDQMVISFSPLQWWTTFYENTKIAQLAALKILTIPVTSAAVERSFSTFGRIHSSKRNRLTTTRAAKLTFISHNWRLLNSCDKTLHDDEESDSSIISSDDSLLSQSQPTVFLSDNDIFEDYYFDV